MNLKLNLKRLEHIKNGEIVFEALLHLGGKATFSELVERITNSVSQPEDVVQSEVKQVLRAAVINGYLVRHGKIYVLSRSCRTMYTDSPNSKIKPSSSEKKIEEGGVASASNFRFPIWWSRFWNRFVVFKERNESCSAESPEKETLNGNEPDSERECLRSTDADISHKSVSMAVPLNDLEANVFDDSTSVSLQETQENKPQPISSGPLEELETDGPFESILTDSRPNARRKELASVSLHAVASVVNPNFVWTSNELKDDNWID